MEQESEIILDTALSVVVRYGMKRTTMADIAREAGVSRQTLYDRYSDKDGIMAAAITLICKRLCGEMHDAFAKLQTLEEKLNAFFELAVYPIYETLQAMPDAADLEKGLGPKSHAATAAAELEKQAVLADMLSSYLPENGPSAADVANFLEQTSSKAKASGIDRQELDRFLSVLHASILAMAKN